eukprot:TRINITY_DN3805_c0_g1_i2.p1 TRINITY_DN3805_c0_g1~~TRINITY_DN3805_c0_g1_i2.p1  ORF type:complete len:248 (-),score=44.34 TRINITY_DN3805_c0_g1_i2:274-1017(-)
MDEKRLFISSSLPEMKSVLGHSWDGIHRNNAKPLIIGVAGGTASGKTSVCNKIISELENQRVATLSLDSFYRPLTEEERSNVTEYNFDHPEAFDWELALEIMKSLAEGRHVDIPEYDFVTHSRLEDKATSIYGADVVLMEGILIFYVKELRELMDLKLFVDADSDTRLARRILRDINERGRQVKGVIRQYEKFVKPAFEEYVLPTKKYADVIIPRGASNNVAINLIVQHIKGRLTERSSARQTITFK